MEGEGLRKVMMGLRAHLSLIKQISLISLSKLILNILLSYGEQKLTRTLQSELFLRVLLRKSVRP